MPTPQETAKIDALARRIDQLQTHILSIYLQIDALARFVAAIPEAAQVDPEPIKAAMIEQRTRDSSEKRAEGERKAITTAVERISGLARGTPAGQGSDTLK